MDQAEPTINITGEKIALGPVRRDLLPLYERWANDMEVARTVSIWGPLTAEQELSWYEGASKGQNGVLFTIYEIGGAGALRPIGNTGLHDIDRQNRTAEFGIMIGEKSAWGKGYGTEAATLILDYGFNILGLHNIYLRVYSFNQRGIKAYTRAGFRMVGSLREAYRIGPRGYDVIIMDCLATEFESKALAKLLPE